MAVWIRGGWQQARGRYRSVTQYDYPIIVVCLCGLWKSEYGRVASDIDTGSIGATPTFAAAC